MKKSKKLVAFVMSMFMACSAATLATACNKNDDDNTNLEQPDGPVKVKDGGEVSVAVGESKQFTVSEYITANGGTVTLNSGNSAAVTASLDGGKLTVTGSAEGIATVKLVCGEVEVTFSVTVTAAVEATPAPVFDALSKVFDVEDGSTEITLAPKSGGDKFDIVYSVAGTLPVEGAQISGDKLTFTKDTVGSYEITINARCTEKNNTQNVKDVTFKVTVRAATYYTVTIDGEAQKVADGDTLTLPATTKQEIPVNKQFEGWQVGAEVKSGGSSVTVTGDMTITAVIGNIAPVKVKDGGNIGFRMSAATSTINIAEYITTNGNPVSVSSSKEQTATVSESGGTVTITAVAVGETVVTITCKDITVTFNVTIEADYYTVTIEGVPQEVISGGTVKLPDQPTAAIPGGQQFMGWQVKDEVVSGGSTITVTEELTITAVLDDIPQTPPEKVKDGDSISFYMSAGSATKTVAEYITANGHTVTASSSSESVATVSVSGGILTVNAVAAGTATVTLTCSTISVQFAVTVKNNVPTFENGTINIDKAVSSTGTYTIQPSSGNASTYSYEYSVTGATEDGGVITATAGSVGTSTLTVNVTATDSATNAVETTSFTVTVNVTDTTEYRVANGNFSNDLTGWTMDGDIGEISENPTFWDGDPIQNVGKYFRGEGKSANAGTLSSSYFTVGGINKITFMLGAAGNDNCYVSLEKSDGTVLAIWRNKQFDDPNCALTLVTYIADLSAYEGQSVKVVLNDNNGDFGFFVFDELTTYYASENDLPQGFEAVNELADKTSLNAKIGEASAITQGDYTDASFNALTDKITEAQAVAADKGATATQVSNAISAIDAAVSGLTARVPEEKSVSKTIAVKSGAEVTVNPTTYVDIKELSSITYELSTSSNKLTVDGLKITAAGDVTEDTDVAAVLTVKYKGETVLTVSLTVKVTSGDKPVVSEAEVTQDIDIYELTDKSKYKIDFGANVENPSELTLTYTVKLEDNTPITLDNQNCYEYDLTDGSYTDVAQAVVFNVTVGSTANSLTVSYKYTLNIKDTTAYRIKNGGFENDLTDWTYTKAQDGPDFGRVVSDNNYWIKTSNVPFGKPNGSNKLFTGIETVEGTNQEAGMGTLKSSAFTLKCNGWISFWMGGAHNVNCGIRVRTVDGDEILAEFNNRGRGVDGTLDKYVYKFTGMSGDTECYIEIFDNASGDWGLVVVDEIETYFESRPDGTEIVPYYTKGQILNGGFETGDTSGWTFVKNEEVDDTFGFVSTSEDAKWGDNQNSYNNDGKFFQNGNEALTGYLLSSVFEVSENGWITFKLGGNKANSYVAIVDADTGEELAKFVNKNFVGAWPDSGWEMYAYKVNLVESGIAAGRSVRIKVVDNATSDYGVITVDSFVTYYESEPSNDFEKINKV